MQGEIDIDMIFHMFYSTIQIRTFWICRKCYQQIGLEFEMLSKAITKIDDMLKF